MLISAFAKTILGLKSILEREYLNAVDGFDANKMIVNLDIL